MKRKGHSTVLLLIGLLVLTTSPQSRADNSFENLSRLSDQFEQLASEIGPTVVQIYSYGITPAAGMSRSRSDLFTKQRSSGSGVILDSDGYIITNAHVVEGARRVQVMLANPPRESPPGRSILKAEGEIVGAQLVGIDFETDLAVLKVEKAGLPFLKFGNSDDLRPGEVVLAFGSPLGLDNSVTFGVVSSVARQLRDEDPMIYIQTDAPINPGNSGGALVNTDGELIGINTLIFSQSGGSEGIGFAAPSNIVRYVYNQIKLTGRVHRGEIGVHVQTIDPLLAEGYGLERTWGVIVADVYPDGPAERAGLEIGDVIVDLEGKIMENGRQFDVNIYQKEIGSTISLGILRGGEKKTLRVQVIERPDDINRFADLVRPEKNLIEQFGILALDLTDPIRRMLPELRYDHGVVVAAGSLEAAYYLGGFLPGDVIYEVNRSRIENLDDLRTVADGLTVGDPVVVQVERDGRLEFLTFEME